MRKRWKWIAIIIVILICLAGALRLMGFRTMRYEAGKSSMVPTISPEDMCLCVIGRDYSSPELRHGGIVLFRHAIAPYLLTKRIIGKEGDFVEIQGNKTFVNGALLDEPYIRPGAEGTDYGDVKEIRVPPNKLFLMGDNRGISLDSRYSEFGLVDVKQVVGKPLLILWSKDKRNIGKRPL